MTCIPVPGEVFQVCPAQTQNLLEGLHFPSGPGTPRCCLSGPGGRAGGRMGFTSDLARVDMDEWIRTDLLVQSIRVQSRRHGGGAG